MDILSPDFRISYTDFGFVYCPRISDSDLIKEMDILSPDLDLQFPFGINSMQVE